MPTSDAASASELLVVMTAKVLCRLIVTTRCVEVEVPDHGSDVLHKGQTDTNGQKRIRSSGTNQIFHSTSWRFETELWSLAGSAEVKVAAARRAMIESLDSMIAVVIVIVLKKSEYV